jgi:hypothetical protein
MTSFNAVPSSKRIGESLVKLARCSKRQRIIVAGSMAPELVRQLHRHGCNRVATMETCGLPHGQYEAALVAWQGHSMNALEATLDWLVHFVSASGALVLWITKDQCSRPRLHSMLVRLGFCSETITGCEHGVVISARRHDATWSAAA